ncbi:MAG TPA: hypothetical protein VNY29_12115 [Terriglobales bacterium]|jgi:hypothetical protein|nr:hypothetical protein [Terriglobales bacterium]
MSEDLECAIAGLTQAVKEQQQPVIPAPGVRVVEAWLDDEDGSWKVSEMLVLGHRLVDSECVELLCTDAGSGEYFDAYNPDRGDYMYFVFKPGQKVDFGQVADLAKKSLEAVLARKEKAKKSRSERRDLVKRLLAEGKTVSQVVELANKETWHYSLDKLTFSGLQKWVDMGMPA